MAAVAHKKISVDSVSVSECATILQGIQCLNESNAQILLVVDENGRLVGTVTDGDIRRAIYVGKPLADAVGDICNRNFKFMSSYDPDLALSYYENYGIRRIPILDDGVAQDIVFIEDVLAGSVLLPSKGKVVIMAGGRGSRLDPITRVVPKPLLPIGDRPILELIMDSFYGQGYEDFILSLNYKKDFIRGYFAERGELPYHIDYVEEENFMGTAGSLSLMKERLTETFFLTNCDILVEMNYRSAFREHVKQENALTVIGVLKNFNIPYGVIQIENGSFASIDEKPDYYVIVNAGVYILEPECLEFVDASSRPDGLFHMTHLMESVKDAGLKVGVFPAHRKWVDIGQWNEYNKLI